MTEQTDAPETLVAPTGDPAPDPVFDTADDPVLDTADDEPPPTANSEAAKYRRRLREAEAERDRLAGLVTGHQRAEVERMASSGIGPAALADGADLWAAGVELAELLDDEDRIDADKVAAVTARVLAEHPGWQRRWPDLGQRCPRSAAGGRPRPWRDAPPGGPLTPSGPPTPPRGSM